MNKYNCSCGQTNPNEFYGRRTSVCKKSCYNSQRVQEFIDLKIKSISHLGGSCKKYSYNAFYGALEFHHIDPEEKKDVAWDKLRLRSWGKVKLELDNAYFFVPTATEKSIIIYGYSSAG